MTLVYELYVVHQAAFSPVYQHWQVRLSPRNWRNRELFPVLRIRREFLDLLFAAKLASGKWVEVEHVGDQSPLLRIETVVPLDERELGGRQRHKGLALFSDLNVVAELKPLVVEPVGRLAGDPFLLVLKLANLVTELIEFCLAFVFGDVHEVLRVVEFLQLVGLELEVVDVLSQLLCLKLLLLLRELHIIHLRHQVSQLVQFCVHSPLLRTDCSRGF